MADETTREASPDTGTLGLINEALGHVTALFRGELDLVRTEMQENLNKAMVAIGMIAGGLVLFLVALNVLAAALVTGLAELGIEAGWASLIVGGVLVILGIIMAVTGKNKLKLASLAPTRTAKNVQRDAHTVKGAATHGR